MAKFHRDDRDDEHNGPGRRETTGGNAALLVALAVLGGGVLVACLGGVAAMFLFTARIEERHMAQEQAAIAEAEKTDQAMAADEVEEVRDFREKVKHYLAEARAAAKLMAGEPSVEDSEKAARRVMDLQDNLPDVPQEIDRTGKVAGKLKGIRVMTAMAAAQVRHRHGFAELGNKAESDEAAKDLVKSIADVTAAADEVEVMVGIKAKP